MSSTKFKAILPLNESGSAVRPGDKIQIKGLVKTNAEQFSINFVNELCDYPQNITYHFKWILADEIIVENNKQNGHWMEHLETEFNQLNGLNFALEFAFTVDGIYVYVIYDGDRNLVTRYEPDHELSSIKAVHVWGDVEKITEFTYKYA